MEKQRRGRGRGKKDSENVIKTNLTRKRKYLLQIPPQPTSEPKETNANGIAIVVGAQMK